MRQYHVVYRSLDVLHIKAQNEDDAQRQAEQFLEKSNKPGWEITDVILINDGDIEFIKHPKTKEVEEEEGR